MQIKKLGWVPDLPDGRDHHYKARRLQPIQSVSLWGKYKSCLSYDQLNLGACTGNAVSYLVQFDLLNNYVQQFGPVFRPSRLFNYWCARFIEGTTAQDAGASLRDNIKALYTYGIPSEDIWPYDVTKYADQPSQEALDQALNFRAVNFESLDNTNKQLLVNCLLEGFPIAFGFTVYDSFMSDQVAATGIVPMPNLSTESVQGGHANVIEGYSLPKDSFLCRNSWGRQWGFEGSYLMPAAYLTNSNLAADFWKLSLIL
ncbi:MAG TPA: C1 family peptidase [Puia sp.]|jgi:C1A family cysteine protease|nr:C1 family peptidase [Puia sp.]